MRFVKVLLWVGFCLGFYVSFSGSAHAFHISEHERMTQLAVEQYQRCFPGVLSDEQGRRITSANVWEDVNLIRKWASYAHFFHPTKSLKLRRKSSIERVEELEARLSAVNDPWESLGQMIHHIQDMAVPSHVVPVGHGLRDGFEAHRVSWNGVTGSRTDRALCDQIVDGTERPSRVLVDVALGTLMSLRERFRATRSGNRVELDWRQFWKEGPGTDFGKYGRFGNTFGSIVIELGPSIYIVQPKVYVGFKQTRMREAILGTQRAIHFFVTEQTR